MKLKLPLTHPLQMIMGFIIWSNWFILIYAGLSLGCMAAPSPETLGPSSWISLTLLAFTVLTAGLLLMLAFRCWRHPALPENKKLQKFVLRVAAAVYLASAIATLVAGLPMLVVSPCL